MTQFKSNLTRHQARKHVKMDKKVKSRTCQYRYKNKLFSEIESDQYLMKKLPKRKLNQ